MTFDPSIFDVVEMPEQLNKNTYIVKFSNGDNIIVDNGRILDENSCEFSPNFSIIKFNIDISSSE
jgi:alpha-ketoglutarate-dependent taurine dioxygenase